MTKNNPSLIHCITNPISINLCANAILALGAKPIMAEHPKEVREITATADALLINLGNITNARMKSIMVSVKEASKKEIPIVLDAVGVACSQLRRRFALKLLRRYSPALIKGNYSEILALCEKNYFSRGIDADTKLVFNRIDAASQRLAQKYNSVVLASGKKDIIADKAAITHIDGGTPQLSEITGTGCVLGAICACYLARNGGMESVASACRFLKRCGEKSVTNSRNGSFITNLLDTLGGAI